MIVRRFVLAAALVLVSAAAFGQQWAVVEPNGTVVSGNLNPAVTRQGPGAYRVTLPLGTASRFVLVTSQTGGGLGDVAETIATVRFDTSNRRVLFINVKAVGVTTGGAATLTQRDGRFSIEVRNGS